MNLWGAMSGKDSVKSICRDCRQSTFHDILHKEDSNGDEDYRFFMSYQIVRCRGCLCTGFRYYYADYESAYPIDEDRWEHPETEDLYPYSMPDYAVSHYPWGLPSDVYRLYDETLKAVGCGAHTLAGVGLRATLEAVCKDQKISGRNLEVRINKLATQGLITKKDSSRLHAIRFLGNDSVHEFHSPKKEQIKAAFLIINHLINSLYVLASDVDGKVDGLITDFSGFEKLINENIKKLKKGDELPLAGILLNSVRRLEGGIQGYESDLVDKIGDGTIKNLSLGKVDIYANSTVPLQHFILI